jgi:hypothetical protein
VGAAAASHDARHHDRDDAVSDTASMAAEDASNASTEDSAGTATATEQPSDERSTTVSDTQSDATGPTDSTDEHFTPPVADAEEPHEVVIPALDERDDVVTDGGTPSDDPGDHRGQPWATTPGERGLDEGTDDDAADAGLDVDMAPHSHESDEDDELAEPANSGTPSDSTDDSTVDSTDGPADGTGSSDLTDSAQESGAASDETSDEQTSEQPAQGDSAAGRRISGFEEVADGGFGLGSAAPIADGAQPLGPAIKGRRDGTTFIGPDDAGYDDVEPDVWFYSEEAARRAGFHRDGE